MLSKISPTMKACLLAAAAGCTVSERSVDDTPVFLETPYGTVTALADGPGKVRGTFEPTSPEQPIIELTAYQIGTSTVVWGTGGDRSASTIQTRQDITPAILSQELAAIGEINARPAELKADDLFQVCSAFPLWVEVVCEILTNPVTLDNSDCDMSSGSYDSCVADYPAGRGGACQCANCSFLCDSVVNDS